MKRKSEPQWKTELINYFYYTKRERDSYFILELFLLGILAHKTDRIFEFNIMMFIITPIIFFICSFFIYRKKKREIEKTKNYVDDETEWEDDDGLPF